MTLLEVRGLSKRFGGLMAVRPLDFALERGEILGLMGPNGAGKTTVFNLIAGYYKPDSGTILFKGNNIAGQHPNNICKLGIARTFQVVKPFGELSVFDNVVVGSFCRAHSAAEAHTIAQRTLELTRLNHRAASEAHNLTISDRKRLEIARALATQPEILLLDEVVGGCNPREAGELVDLIRQVRDQGVTILMIEHVLRAMMTLSDRIIVLQHGEAIACGRPTEIATDEKVIAAYLGERHAAKPPRNPVQAN